MPVIRPAHSQRFDRFSCGHRKLPKFDLAQMGHTTPQSILGK
jgi:hypothetical protein